MAYSTQADVQNAVGGAANLRSLTDFASAGAVDAAVVAAAIAEADALIDSYASKRFAVPIAAPPTAIKTLSARIAARFLRRNRAMGLVQDIEEEKSDRKWLEALAMGGVLPGAEPLPAQGSIVTDTAGPRDTTKNVSRDRLKGWW